MIRAKHSLSISYLFPSYLLAFGLYDVQSLMMKRLERVNFSFVFYFNFCLSLHSEASKLWFLTTLMLNRKNNKNSWWKQLVFFSFYEGFISIKNAVWHHKLSSLNSYVKVYLSYACSCMSFQWIFSQVQLNFQYFFWPIFSVGLHQNQNLWSETFQLFINKVNQI